MYNEDGGNNLFFSILVRSILEDSVAAFEHYDFRKQLKNAEVRSKCTGGMDTVNVTDLDGNVVGLSVGKKEFPVDSVYQFQLMEEVFFDKESSKLLRRIIGLAPMGPLVVNGKVIPGQSFPYFWVYYPDLRRNLAKKQVYNPKNLNSNQTWEDYLESHQYSYYIIKSTMDNYRDQKYSDYIKDPLFRLFEGEKFKSQMFSYEQSLWSY
jgi:gliding motility associated protien GldN